MSKQIEALKLALEFLEALGDNHWNDRKQTITAIKEALAQTEQDGKCKYCTDGCPACDAKKLPEQEPVATLWQHGETGRTRITMPDDITDCDARWFKAADLYTTPPQQELVCVCGAVWEGQELIYTRPQRKPLTDEEIKNLINEFFYLGMKSSFRHYANFARAIEAAIWEKLK